MNWLRRLIGGSEAGVAVPAEAPEDAIREGFERECAGDLDGAAQRYARALELDAGSADAAYYLGRLASGDRREAEAISWLQRAVECAPGEAYFLGALGDTLIEGKRYAEAADAFAAGLRLLPECAVFRIHRAVGLIETQRRDEALAELEPLLATLPDSAELHFNLAGIYHQYGRSAEAIASYRLCLRQIPHHAPSFDNLLLALNYSAAHGADEIFEAHRRYGERFARGYATPRADPAWPRRLRVGYVSPDFRTHSVAYFIEPIVARHDRERFEVFCYHVHPLKDRFTEKLRAQADHWRDCEELSDQGLAARIAEDRIDLLIDLAGHTSDNRLLAFSFKPAPVQATYLGYPNTSGLGAMDWHVTDAWADPPEAARHNVERLAYVPGSYFCYRPPPEYPDVAPLPAGDSGGITFGCFNNFPKLSLPFLDALARILHLTPGSRLILKSQPLSNPNLVRRVRERFDAANIPAERVDLRGWEAGTKGHLAIYGSVDLALDSFPYNGATTTCEAMWMGVPVVTLSGDRHAGRMGASLLHTLGLPELVTTSVEQYVATSVALAGDRKRLRELRESLRERLRGSPLMDEAGFTRRLEACYLDMWHQREQPLAPSASPAQGVGELLARARALREARKPAEAQALSRNALELDPAHPEALELFWNLAFDLQEPGAAVEPLGRAIALRGDQAHFQHMLGCSLQAQGLAAEAAQAFRRALELDPRLARTHNNLGVLLEAAGDLAGAKEAYRAAVREDPTLAQALYNLGNACRQEGRIEDASRHIAAALALDPAQPEWHCNLGDLQFGRLQFDEALASYRAALAADSAHLRAHAKLGLTLLVLGQAAQADAAFADALKIRPDPETESWRLLLSHFRDDPAPEAQFRQHREWAKRHERQLPRVTAHPGRPRARVRRLNVGYLAPQFTEHSLATFLEPVAAAHDRAKVRLFAYSNAKGGDARLARLRGHFEHWRAIEGVADAELAERIRADGIDILVDLAGHAAGNRMTALARKPAPVQVSWLGYPGSTGLDALDYRITDAIADPAGEADTRHSEKLVRLPGFICFSPPAALGEAATAPRAGGPTFACVDGLMRASPSTIALWGCVLQRVPGSRLVLRDLGFAASSARRRVLEALQAHGIEPSRIVLEPLAPEADPLAAWQGADIALDTAPWNGLASSRNALWMGVPVVTLAGATHASRIGASLLQRAGLGELVAATPDAFVAACAALAAEPARLAALRGGMRTRLQASPLCDVKGFTRELEGAFQDMWSRA